jgi:hypothetical protein
VSPQAADAAVDRIAQRAPGRPVERSSRREPASHVLLPTSPRGARPGPEGASGLHRALHVVTVTQERQPSMEALHAALAESRPGLVRAKGRLVVDDRVHLVQLTPQSIEIVEAPNGPCALTLIGLGPADVHQVIDLIAPTIAPMARTAAVGHEQGDQE